MNICLLSDIFSPLGVVILNNPIFQAFNFLWGFGVVMHHELISFYYPDNTKQKQGLADAEGLQGEKYGI